MWKDSELLIRVPHHTTQVKLHLKHPSLKKHHLTAIQQRLEKPLERYLRLLELKGMSSIKFKRGHITGNCTVYSDKDTYRGATQRFSDGGSTLRGKSSLLFSVPWHMRVYQSNKNQVATSPTGRGSVDVTQSGEIYISGIEHEFSHGLCNGFLVQLSGQTNYHFLSEGLAEYLAHGASCSHLKHYAHQYRYQKEGTLLTLEKCFKLFPSFQIEENYYALSFLVVTYMIERDVEALVRFMQILQVSRDMYSSNTHARKILDAFVNAQSADFIVWLEELSLAFKNTTEPCPVSNKNRSLTSQEKMRAMQFETLNQDVDSKKRESMVDDFRQIRGQPSISLVANEAGNQSKTVSQETVETPSSYYAMPQKTNHRSENNPSLNSASFFNSQPNPSSSSLTELAQQFEDLKKNPALKEFLNRRKLNSLEQLKMKLQYTEGSEQRLQDAIENLQIKAFRRLVDQNWLALGTVLKARKEQCITFSTFKKEIQKLASSHKMAQALLKQYEKESLDTVLGVLNIRYAQSSMQTKPSLGELCQTLSAFKEVLNDETLCRQGLKGRKELLQAIQSGKQRCAQETPVSTKVNKK